MYASRIKMKKGCYYSQHLTEIDQIYIADCTAPGFYDKAVIYDYLKNNPGKIWVGISPYPDLVPVLSIYGEKYVRSEPNDTPLDNLLKLPRE